MKANQITMDINYKNIKTKKFERMCRVSLAKKLNLIEAVSVDYSAGERMGYESYEHIEEVALEALNEAIEVLEDFSYIFDLQLKLITHNITHKIHSKQIIEINNIHGGILDIILEVYSKYYSNNNIYKEDFISKMYVVDEGSRLCTIILPYNL